MGLGCAQIPCFWCAGLDWPGKLPFFFTPWPDALAPLLGWGTAREPHPAGRVSENLCWAEERAQCGAGSSTWFVFWGLEQRACGVAGHALLPGIGPSAREPPPGPKVLLWEVMLPRDAAA